MADLRSQENGKRVVNKTKLISYLILTAVLFVFRHCKCFIDNTTVGCEYSLKTTGSFI